MNTFINNRHVEQSALLNCYPFTAMAKVEPIKSVKDMLKQIIE